MAIAPPSLHKSLYAKYPCVSHNFRFRHSLRFSCRPFRFTATASSAVSLETDLSIQKNQTEETDLFSCPVCYEPLIRKGPPGLNLAAIYRSGFKCKQCDKSYSSKDTYLDLTVTAGLRDYTEVKPAGTELFRSPFVSFVYERGWRQNFNRRGFSGPDEEFRMAQEYFKPVEGGILVDVSCGSGLFSRKFAKSRIYSGVIALDFSENMLRQCNDFIEQDACILASNIALVRADVSRLPFSSGSIDAVHAGAALHCWPSPLNAVAEISSILRSGGVFVGSTFLRYTSSTPRIIRPFRERVLQITVTLRRKRSKPCVHLAVLPTIQERFNNLSSCSRPRSLKARFGLIVVGTFFGVEILSGVLTGSFVSGVQAGALEYARIVDPKGSRPHKAAIGDPLKDTSGQSLNILIKLMAVKLLVFATHAQFAF
ncbi:hypothetical protein GOBAR_AA16764 [Gossypium barbadense]|uniref:H(+)-exporting diphosphatase n=1 Tax=Gossypium barbadense TaxID=3634 RepID=A0A2P5XKS2_GOSBA|nr:hypothetical protein GOBAR_AA16764 [Gossypium barbadense]